MARMFSYKHLATLSQPILWAIAFFIIQLILLCLALAKNFSSIPFWDMWNGGLEWYLDLPANGFVSFFAQHNEHRIPLTRFLIWLDYTFFQGLGVFLIVINVLLALTIILILLIAFKQEIRMSLTSTKAAIAITGSAMFGLSWLQRENFSWAFQSQFYLAYLIPLLTFIAYSNSLKRSPIWTVISLALAFISAFTMSNGIFVLPLLLIVSLLTRQNFKLLFVQVFLSVLMLAIFFDKYNFNTTGASPFSNLFNDPIGVLKFFTLLLGSPGFFMFGKDYASAGIAGLMGVGVLFLTVYLFFSEFKSVKLHLLKNPIFLFILYSLASLFLISLGRSGLGLTQVFASRYCTPVLFLYLALLLLLLSKSHNSRIPSYVVAIFIIPIALVQLNGYIAYGPEKQERNLAGIATALGVQDKEVTDRIWPFENAKELANRASEAKVSAFGQPPFVNLEGTLGSLNERPFSSCRLYLESVRDTQVQGGYLVVQGWLATLHSGGKDFAWLSDKSGRVVGLGVSGNERLDVEQTLGGYSQARDFTAYVLHDNSWQLGQQDVKCDGIEQER